MMLNDKLNLIKEHIKTENTYKIMIIGLGSVGTYLLDYLLSENDERMQIIVVGRNREKMEKNVNIVRVASLIRKKCKASIAIVSDVDLDDVNAISDCLKQYQPDFIVNSSRVYSGLKYGSISWKAVRAYGIWSPLAVKYIKNIMRGYELSESKAIVINTSYSDATIPWLKSSKSAYPDFGSGNLNHLIPRIKYAVAKMLNVPDFWNVEVTIVTSHFHDVLISKEGKTENVYPLIDIRYKNSSISVDIDKVYEMCSIAMPVDEKRNMMNASSNFDIISSIIRAIDNDSKEVFFSPGALGNIGGYPIAVCNEDGILSAQIDESVFDFEQMNKTNRKSIYLDGIEDVANGTLIYTDELLQKVRNAFNVELPKKILLNESDEVAGYIIEKIIKPALGE